ncbi:MAG TPA: hypothetical protein VK948_01910 [Aeromicrobium sp.]|nr:hypothetical protein [Aeromicrobium sp.]
MRVLAWLAVGALYGVVLRTWMRFVSTEKEFSWSGTGYIIGIFAVLGLMAGLVGFARRRGWVRRLVALRAVGSVLALGCFMAAGALMFPTIVPAALGVGRTDWAMWLRRLLIAVGAGSAGFVVLTLPELGLAHRLVALALYLALAGVEVVLLARIVAPSLPRGSIMARPVAVRAALVVLPLMAVAALVISAIGVPQA